jgi:predicted lipoprotein with Yx(FWY)xxD motif
MDDASLNVAEDAKLGKILTDGKGMVLYMFTKDEPDKSNCNEACLAVWPPLLTKGNPKLGAGVDPKLVGSATLPNGSRIVTYNKMPLYYYVKDTKPGETLGQDVGKVWYVVSPDGKVIGMQPPATASTPAAAAFSEPTINVAQDAKLGKILVDGKGMTLYLFTKDEPGKSNCVDACLTNWPPLVTQGKPNLGTGVDPAKVGTATLSDGRKIVTYNQLPLYYFAKDTKAGDTTGQGVNNVWFIVAP